MMSNIPDKPDGAKKNSEVVIVLVALVVIILGMVASYYYPYPSGERPSFFSLFIFWNREALLVGFAAVVLFAALVGWLWKAVRSLAGGKDAL